MPALLRESLRELREQRGLSRDELSGITAANGEHVTVGNIRKYEKEPGRVPGAEKIEALARALEVPPQVLAFHEYPIALAKKEGTSEYARRRLSTSLADRAESSRRLKASGDTRTAPARRQHQGK